MSVNNGKQRRETMESREGAGYVKVNTGKWFVLNSNVQNQRMVMTVNFVHLTLKAGV